MNECVISTPEWISSLGHYKASKPIELVAKDIGIKPEEIIMLVANENPLGMSEKVRQKISEAIFNLNRYPDADAWPLKTALAKKLNVPEDWIVLGNGSSELLGLSGSDGFIPGKFRNLSAVLVFSLSDGRAFVRCQNH